MSPRRRQLKRVLPKRPGRRTLGRRNVRSSGFLVMRMLKRMTRISYRRASPENWEKTIKRMVSLNHVNLEPADARNILKYLADHNGLAPEELRPIAFEAERRTIDYTYLADKDTSDTCSSCHTIARVMSERRTKDEWGLLVNMHRGYYPLVDNQPMNGGQGFRRTRPAETQP